MTLTRHEVETLNIHATNHTRARHDEHGMDWDYWTYYPVRIDQGHYEGGFTDGHSYAGHPSIPDEGWVPVDPNMSIPVDKVVGMLRDLDTAINSVRKVSDPKRGLDRVVAATTLIDTMRKIRGRLNTWKSPMV